MRFRIMRAAVQEMNARGIKFTVDAVAQRLGISKKTIYQYYRSKDELIEALYQVILNDIVCQQNEIIKRDCPIPDKLLAMLQVEPRPFDRLHDWVFDDVRKFRPDIWEKVRLFRHERLMIIVQLLEQGITSGHIRPIHPQVGARMILGMVNELFQYDFLQENNLTFREGLHAVADIFLHGVLNQPGITQINSSFQQQES